jgi:disulfide bond formation protein DsbB
MYKKITNLIKKIFQDYYELAVAISASSIIMLAIILDKFMYLQACPMCILTRYVFGLIAVSAIVGIFFKSKLIGGLLMTLSSLIGLFVSSRQIYIQNMSIEQIVELSGCGMPFHTQVEYFGLIDAINKTLAGGPSCAEDGWRFVFNFAEWGFIFFLIFFISTIFKYRKY